MAVKPIKQKLLLRLFKARRKGHKARVNGATCVCQHIAKQLRNGDPLEEGIKFFDVSVPGEFALCSWCARYFVMVGPEETTRQLRLVNMEKVRPIL